MGGAFFFLLVHGASADEVYTPLAQLRPLLGDRDGDVVGEEVTEDEGVDDGGDQESRHGERGHGGEGDR